MTMTMTTTTTLDNQSVDPINRSPVAANARGRELIDLHRRAGHLVAELSEGTAWVDVDHIATRLIVEAQAIGGVSYPDDAGSVAPIVRCRELAVAQRRLVLVLEDEDGLDVGDAAVVRARALLAELVEVAAGQRATLRR